MLTPPDHKDFIDLAPAGGAALVLVGKLMEELTATGVITAERADAAVAAASDHLTMIGAAAAAAELRRRFVPG